MSLAASCILEVQLGASDTLNGGLFNPGATLNSDLAATNANTSSPVVTSATYNFTSVDNGMYLFVKAGTNWTPGWYPVVSTSGGAATLNAAIGAVVLYSTTYKCSIGMNTVAGCAATASPTAGNWAVDYSQNTSAAFALTGLTTAAANAIILTVSATVAMIGNGLVVKAGTNFTIGYYQIDSAVAGVSLTVDRNCTTGIGAAGTAGVGGAFSSISVAVNKVAASGTVIMWKYNASVYQITTSSTGVATGCIAFAVNATIICGYDTSRFIGNTDANRPKFQVNSGVSGATQVIGNASLIMNVWFDGNSQATSRGIAGIQNQTAWNCKLTNFVSGAFNSSGAQASAWYCEISGCSTTTPVTGHIFFCYLHDNTITAFAGMTAEYCKAANNTGSTSVHGFAPLSNGRVTNCDSYGNAGAGFAATASVVVQTYVNCIAEGNGNYGWLNNQTNTVIHMRNCADYNNTNGRKQSSTDATNPIMDIGAISGSSTFFTNAASGDFSLNNTATGGALLRGLGFPRVFPGGLSTGYADVGAIQHADPVGVSGARIFGGF